MVDVQFFFMCMQCLIFIFEKILNKLVLVVYWLFVPLFFSNEIQNNLILRKYHLTGIVKTIFS